MGVISNAVNVRTGVHHRYKYNHRAPCTRVRCKASSTEEFEKQWEAERKEEEKERAAGRVSRSRGTILTLEMSKIRRPLGLTRENNQAKVEVCRVGLKRASNGSTDYCIVFNQALMLSIEKEGQKVPIDVLLVEGEYFSFSGCHRFEAHQRLGKPTIIARVMKASKDALR